MTPSEGEDSDRMTQEKIYYSYVLTCSVDSLSFFLPHCLFPQSVVVVNFTDTVKSN